MIADEDLQGAGRVASWVIKYQTPTPQHVKTADISSYPVSKPSRIHPKTPISAHSSRDIV
jgi:hypothetical protein